MAIFSCIKATLEYGEVSCPPEPIDPITANNYEDDKDKEGTETYQIFQRQNVL